jgi:hypothetical protein
MKFSVYWLYPRGEWIFIYAIGARVRWSSG